MNSEKCRPTLNLQVRGRIGVPILQIQLQQLIQLSSLRQQKETEAQQALFPVCIRDCLEMLRVHSNNQLNNNKLLNNRQHSCQPQTNNGKHKRNDIANINNNGKRNINFNNVINNRILQQVANNSSTHNKAHNNSIHNNSTGQRTINIGIHSNINTPQHTTHKVTTCSK